MKKAEELARAADAARVYTFEVDGRKFTMRLPTRHEQRVAYMRHGAEDSVPAFVLAMRELIERAVIGWEGVTDGDIIGDPDNKDGRPFDASLVRYLLDNRDDLQIALARDFSDRVRQRSGAIEEAEKN